MADLKPQVRELATAIDAKKAEAAKAFAEFDALRKSAVAEGVDFAKDADAFEKIDAAGKTYDTIRDEVSTMESRRARLLEIAGEKAIDLAAKKGEDAVRRTFGEAFVKSAAYAAAKERIASSDNVPLGTTDGVKVADRSEFKTLLSSSGAQSPLADRQGFIIATPLKGLDFLSMIATSNTDSDVVEYLEETTYTNSAAEVAEGTAAAESALAFTKRTANVKEIAHFLPVTRRALNDQAFIEGWVNNRLVDGVRRRLQDQILNGDGTGENLSGIYGNAGIGSVDRSVTGTTMLDSLHKAITTVRTNSFMEPDFIGINPADWESIRTSKAASAGTYLFGDPSSNGPATVWGIPVVVHAAFTSGAPLVGVASEANLWIKEGVSVAASDSHSDYFTKRQVALLASARVAFALVQPKAFAVSVA